MPEPRFLTVPDVAEILATSAAQVKALIKRGDLRAIQIGGRNQWRVETVELEDYIRRMYERADHSGPGEPDEATQADPTRANS
ncbi:MAG TPA: helix-turn-helix domain-containing protein [Nocardioidaceae bacterium]|nr:helix-turn-helix domain-containing protein [Nocardioidaceae bacterium]